MRSMIPAPLTPEGRPAGNIYDKYGTRNPIARKLVQNFLGTIPSLVANLPVATILDVGCGEGYLTQHLQRSKPHAGVWGTDISHAILEEAKRFAPSIPFFTASIYDLPHLERSFELVVACEVLEHLDSPREALLELLRVTRRYLLLSVPREPLWRILNVLRGAYVPSFGNTPGHVNHWSRKGFLRFLEGNVQVQAVRSPLPWIMVLGTKAR